MARELCTIATSPLVEQLRGADISLSQQGVRFYPDGSMLVVYEMNAKLFGEISDVFRQIAPEGVGLVGFRSLAPFGDRTYDLLYPGWYADKVDKLTGSGVLIGPGIAARRVPAEDDPSHLRVSLDFYRALPRDGLTDLACALRTWFADVGSKGAFEEGGASSISSHLRYHDKRVAFELDLHDSGMETVNTLILAVLSWGMSGRRPLSSFTFAGGADRFHSDAGGDELSAESDATMIVPLL
jgi:hypothetical protein